MRSLNVTDNTDDATGDYPFRKVRDTVGATDGTKLWERVFSDLIHGLQKLIRLVGLVPNELPDNETNGYQILDALELLGQSRTFQGNWTDGGGGDKYILASDIKALVIGKMYRFISDKNLLPSDNIYLKVIDSQPVAVNYAIKFQNCSFILANQVFNVYVTAANNVTVTSVGSLNEFYGSAINRFETYSSLGTLGSIFKYKGKYYVTRRFAYEIKIYSNEGKLEQTLSPADLSEPRGITVIDDKIYIANYNFSDITVFNLTGSFLFNFGSAQFINPFIVRSSAKTGKIYALSGGGSSNAFAYNASDGLYSFTFSSTDQFKDIVIHGEDAYTLAVDGSGDTYISKYNATNGALITGITNKFLAAETITRFYGINDNYFILKSGNDVVLADKNYNITGAGDPYRDILKTVIFGYNFEDGNIDGGELYFIDNSSAAGRFSINKFI